MTLVLKTPKVSEFLNLTKAEELLPKSFTRLRSVSISTKDIVKVSNVDDLSDVQLLKGVPVDKYRYVGIVGIVVSGEWLLPDNVRGGVTISFVDKRLVNSREAIIGTYRAAAKEKRFQFKLIPNYFVTSADAKRNPWQAHVKLRGIRIEEGWSPLTIEVVSVAICANSIVLKGLREKILNVVDPNVEGFEGAVDEFIDSVPASQSLNSFRSKRRNLKKGKVNGYRNGSEKFADLETFDQSEEDAVHSDQPKSVPVLLDGLGSAQASS